MKIHENSEQVIEARLPGPGNRVDDYTVMAEDAKIDWSDMPKHVHYGFRGLPIGEVLDVRRKQTAWQRFISWLCPSWAKQKGHILMRAKVDMDKLRQASDEEIKLQPGFIVRKMRTEGDKRIIEAADLTHISIGFRYTSEARPSLWERLKAWVHRIGAKAKALLRSK